MLSTHQLSTEDLDDLFSAGSEAGEPLPAAGRLVEAVEQDRIADKNDIGYALLLAAELTEAAGDLTGALALVERGIEAYRTHGTDRNDGFPRASRAGLLIELGRTDEGLAELTELRPLLETDPNAGYIIEVLAEYGHAELAEQWLTEALRSVLQVARSTEDEPAADAEAATTDEPELTDSDPASPREQAVAMAYGLAQQRHQIRADLGLPHDDLDHLADELRAAAGEEEPDDVAGNDVALIFWPRSEFDAVLQRWPALTGAYGETWDEHRAETERAMVELSDAGASSLGLLPGSAESFAEFSPAGDAPLDEEILADYFEVLVDDVEAVIWPPGRNEACWCGSGDKYKKCCLPRSRA